MTHDSHDVDQFRKNRYFEGKLLTARDMETEQTYHARRLETLARHTVGTGVLDGLDVRAVAADDGRLSVTVGPGVALDGLGRLLTVDSETTMTVPAPPDGPVYLQLRYTERPVEAAVDLGETTGEEATSHLVEGVEVTYTDTQPQGPPDIDGTDPVTVAERLRERRRARSGDDPAVYVGAAQRRPDGEWTVDPDGPPRETVCDNDLLFSTLDATSGAARRHTRDTTGASEGVTDRLDRLERQVERLQHGRDELAQYLLGTVARDTERLFERAADSLGERDDTAARRARAVTDAIPAVDGGVPNVDAWGPLIDAAVSFGDTLDGVVTAASRQRYLGTVEAFQTVLDGEADALDVATAQDDLAEAAGDLVPVYEVTTDGR